jgi:hypothetical protein
MDTEAAQTPALETGNGSPLRLAQMSPEHKESALFQQWYS